MYDTTIISVSLNPKSLLIKSVLLSSRQSPEGMTHFTASYIVICSLPTVRIRVGDIINSSGHLVSIIGDHSYCYLVLVHITQKDLRVPEKEKTERNKKDRSLTWQRYRGREMGITPRLDLVSRRN